MTSSDSAALHDHEPHSNLSAGHNKFDEALQHLDAVLSVDAVLVLLYRERLQDFLVLVGAQEVCGVLADYVPATVREALAVRVPVGALSLYLSLRGRYEDDVRVVDAVDQLREEICR